MPEIDILEVEKNKTANSVGQVVSQSAQFAPFTHDYMYLNDTTDEYTIYNPSITRPNDYRGSAVLVSRLCSIAKECTDGFIRCSQQALSALTNLPDDMFQGSGANFKTLGFEYWANPSNRNEGFITWQSNGQPTYRIGATAMGPDQGTGGSQVGARLIPEEPMVRGDPSL